MQVNIKISLKIKLDHAVECHTHERTHANLAAEQSDWSAKILALAQLRTRYPLLTDHAYVAGRGALKQHPLQPPCPATPSLPAELQI